MGHLLIFGVSFVIVIVLGLMAHFKYRYLTEAFVIMCTGLVVTGFFSTSISSPKDYKYVLSVYNNPIYGELRDQIKPIVAKGKANADDSLRVQRLIQSYNIKNYDRKITIQKEIIHKLLNEEQN